MYVDDIIFRSNVDKLCQLFVNVIQMEFEMSMLGELFLLLLLQVQQIDKRNFISQTKYIKNCNFYIKCHG